MDEVAKKKIAVVRKLIQEKQFQAAIDDLQVMVYKYAKLYQIHLMAGLCYSKLERYLDAEKAFLEVLDLKPDETNAVKELCDIYTRRGDMVKSTKYMEMNAQLFRTTDDKKYRETIVKLVQLYDKDDNLEKIDPIFQDYVAREEKIGEDFVKIANSYFKVGVRNQCFNLQHFQKMGLKGDGTRGVVAGARQPLNRLLIDVVGYLLAVANQYQLSRKDIANSIIQMKLCFPEASCMLMMLLFDQYCVGQLGYANLIFDQVYKLMQAYFDRSENAYFNMEYTEPELFTVCMILSYEYLAFFKEFFSLEEMLQPYFVKLAACYEDLQTACVIRDDYRKKIGCFILKECRQLYSQSRFGNVQNKLEELKHRILSLSNSYLEEVIAKIAINCFTSYDKINDMKNLLKLRIKNLPPNEPAPHLYKYYYEYIFKIARLFKSLDEEIPLTQIHEYISVNDPKDFKYVLEKVWFEFSMSVKGQDAQSQLQIAKVCLNKILEAYPQLETSLKSGALRKIILLNIFLGNYEITTQIGELLAHERSFQNLQCAGFYFYFKKQYKQCLILLKEAFRLNQLHYHTNRLLFLALVKTGAEKQAISFLERIHEGFTSVFWVNFLIGINKINSRKYLEAEVFMNSALESFEAGSAGKFRFSYERVKDIGASFSLLYLVQQNEYGIFYDEIIFPEEFIYSEMKVLSSLYCTQDASRNRIGLYLKEAELLKILGRTKTSLNYVQEAYNEASSLQIGPDSDLKLLLEICLVKKEYCTLLFYMRQFKESQAVLYEGYQIITWLLVRKQQQNKKWESLFERLDNQIKALSFEISVDRLSIMMRFESYEFISEYIAVFRSRIEYPSKPSLNFYKNKYQFHILEYMHSRGSTSDFEKGVSDFLRYFQLNLEERQSISFADRLFELGEQDRKSVRESLEDYFIVRYMVGGGLSEQELLCMVGLFPRSNAFYILLGMVSIDVKIKTAAFLKCIQLDKESSISIDILASLYLKQKNYLAAAKLFLKSLELDILNPKCYLGLAICLFCLISRAIETQQPDQVSLIRKCVVRINSYMEYLRLSDPSENYHLLNFLKLLLTEEKRTNFDIKLVLQSAQRAFHKYKNSLLDELLQQSTRDWQHHNIWKNQEQLSIINNYIRNNLKSSENDYHSLASHVANKLVVELQALAQGKNELGRELFMKQIERLLNELAVGLNLAIKSGKFSQSLFSQYCKFAERAQKLIEQGQVNAEELNLLKYKLKGYFYDYLFISEDWSVNKAAASLVFPSVSYYQFFGRYPQKILNLQREISRQMLIDPTNESLRQIFNAYLVGKKNILARKAKLSYKLELINSLNENMINDQSCYKKLILLYNDPTANVLFIAHRWNDSSLKDEKCIIQLLRRLLYLEQRSEIKDHSQLKEKVYRMKLEMLAFYTYKFGACPLAVTLNVQEKSKMAKLLLVNQVIDCTQRDKKSLKAKLVQLGACFKGGKIDEFDWWILLGVFSHAKGKFMTSQRYEKSLNSLLVKATDQKMKAFIWLLQLVSVLQREVNSEEDLVNQIMTVTEISSKCTGAINPNTDVIIECSRSLLTDSFDDIESELNRASQTNKVVTYSDQILINFFEVIRLYKAAETNPNGEKVIDSFNYMCQCMVDLAKEPLLKGFFLSLKGIVASFTLGDTHTKDRNIKLAMLLSPQASKSLLGIA